MAALKDRTGIVLPRLGELGERERDDRHRCAAVVAAAMGDMLGVTAVGVEVQQHPTAGVTAQQLVIIDGIPFL